MVHSTVRAGKEKRSLEYLVATENKEGDKKQNAGACQSNTGANVKEVPSDKSGTI